MTQVPLSGRSRTRLEASAALVLMPRRTAGAQAAGKDGDIEQLTRDQLFKFTAQFFSHVVRFIPMHDRQ